VTPNAQTLSGPSNSKPTAADHVKQLAVTLLVGTRRGVRRAGRARTAPRAARPRCGRPAHLPALSCRRSSSPTERHCCTGSGALPSPRPPRKPRQPLRRPLIRPEQELLRRMNMAPGGTSALIAMRSELTAHLRDEPELKLLDADLRHLLSSWFNRGFLELRRIDWQSPGGGAGEADRL